MSDGALRCRTALDRPLVPLVLLGRPLSMLYDLVMQDAEASSRLPPGIVGGESSSRRSGERISQRRELRVELGDTLEAALDRLVAVGVPFGWGVIERDEASTSPCQIVLFTEDTVLIALRRAVPRTAVAGGAAVTIRAIVGSLTGLLASASITTTASQGRPMTNSRALASTLEAMHVQYVQRPPWRHRSPRPRTSRSA